MGSYSLQRGLGTGRTALFDAFIRGPEDVTHVDRLRATISRLERKLRAIELIPTLDAATLRAATAHTRLVCGHDGYQLVEVDEPPPAAGTTLEHEGLSFTVWRLAPSPLPGDTRRCAVLMPD